MAAYAAIAAAAVGATSALYSADTQQNTAEANAEMARRQGNQEKDAAIAQAEKIRKAARAAAGQANASMAAAGVAIGEGTPLRINEQIYKDSEDDAYSTLLTGTRRQQSANDQASFLEAEGSAAATSGYLNAGATLLSAAGTYGKWKASQKGGGE
ncbi:MAG TPA: hypothetical protein DCX52_14055 [Massilia sp.]|nr:hypothetical protein [Massilia sp.]